MQKKIEIGADIDAMDWLCAKIGCKPFSFPYRTIALKDDNGYCAVSVLERVSKDGAHIHVAARNGYAMTPRFFVQVFYEAFIRLDLPRLTGLVPISNTRALRFDRHLGFVTEGLMRKACNGEDLVILGMVKDECRYIRNIHGVENGKA